MKHVAGRYHANVVWFLEFKGTREEIVLMVVWIGDLLFLRRKKKTEQKNNIHLKSIVIDAHKDLTTNRIVEETDTDRFSDKL